MNNALPAITTATKTVRVKRLDGSRTTVEIADVQHYEIDIQGSESGDLNDYDAFYIRYEIVRADDAKAARALGRAMLVKDHAESVSAVRKITHGDVAVKILHGMLVVA